MAKCKNCVNCTEIELESIEIEDGIIGSYWMCYCNLSEAWIDESDNSDCPAYAEDRTRKHE